MNLKEFTKIDWYGFAGAENFPEGSAPLIGEENNYFVVADANGIELHLNPDNEDEESIWYLHCHHTSSFYKIFFSTFHPTVAEAFLRLIGFKKHGEKE
jgi:hypothetical protein